MEYTPKYNYFYYKMFKIDVGYFTLQLNITVFTHSSILNETFNLINSKSLIALKDLGYCLLWDDCSQTYIEF